MVAHAEGAHDGSVDLLICGCEVSLWLGEQFASDLHNAFPQLKVVTISANKILASSARRSPSPQTGFCFNETLNVKRATVVMLISHSGGTFATLNIANLLKAYTKNIFCVSSEWDTAGRARRSARGRPAR